MKFKFVLSILILFLASSSYGSELSKIKATPNAVPTMVWFMIKHIDQYPLDNYSSLDVVEDLIELETNLSNIKPVDIKVFLMSQLYKSLFNFNQSRLIDAKNLHISKSHILSATEKMKKTKVGLGEGLIYLMQKMIEDYKPFVTDNSLSNYQNTSQKNQVSKEVTSKIHLLNKHVGPWIMLFLRFDSKKFNQYYSLIIKKYIQSAVHLSYLFKFHQYGESPTKLFTYQDGGIQTLKSKLTSSKQVLSADPEESAQDAVKNLNIEPGDGSDQKIESIINNLEQKTE